MKKLNNSFFIYFSIFLILAVVSISGSYAWYTANVENDLPPYETVITTGSLQMGFTNSQYFNVNNMVIISPEEVATKATNSSFDVNNTGDNNASYDLYFNATISNNLIHQDFKWELIIDGVSHQTGNFGSITKNTEGDTTTASFKITNAPITLTPNNHNSCVFRVWLQEANRNQIDLTEGSLTGNVSLRAVAK